jgi:hypothetical protein
MPDTDSLISAAQQPDKTKPVLSPSHPMDEEYRAQRGWVASPGHSKSPGKLEFELVHLLPKPVLLASWQHAFSLGSFPPVRPGWCSFSTRDGIQTLRLSGGWHVCGFASKLKRSGVFVGSDSMQGAVVWIFASLQNPYVHILASEMVVLGETLGRWLGHKRGALMIELVALSKEPREFSGPFHHVRHQLWTRK